MSQRSSEEGARAAPAAAGGGTAVPDRWGSPTGPPRDNNPCGKEIITTKKYSSTFSETRERREPDRIRRGEKRKHELAKASKEQAPKMSAPTAPYDAPPQTNHLLSDSEKPSHASSLAGRKDADDADATAATTTTTPAKTRTPSVFSRKWALGPVVKDYGDYGLLACSFVTGMVDGASFLNWGVFVGMQTGEFLVIFWFCFLGWRLRCICLMAGLLVRPVVRSSRQFVHLSIVEELADGRH